MDSSRGSGNGEKREMMKTAILSLGNLESDIWFSLNFLFRFNFNDGTPSANFDTFPAAIMTVFQVWGQLIAQKHYVGPIDQAV